MHQPSELILTPRGTIYHLDLHPEQIADTIITVGDPKRVEMVSRHFDRITDRAEHREFVTNTGALNGRRLTVISTGIGTDNIDIVFNELDALANIDFRTRENKDRHRRLRFVRLGTSGALRSELPLDSFLVSRYALGLDGLMNFYRNYQHPPGLGEIFRSQTDYPLPVYGAVAAADLVSLFAEDMHPGITLTCPGFYAPQGRSLRGGTILDRDFFKSLQEVRYQETRVTNFEMETAGILGLARHLGHDAVSCSVLLANRIDGTFSSEPGRAVERLIEVALARLTR